jgi:hypothetical protein
MGHSTLTLTLSLQRARKEVSTNSPNPISPKSGGIQGVDYFILVILRCIPKDIRDLSC